MALEVLTDMRSRAGWASIRGAAGFLKRLTALAPPFRGSDRAQHWPARPGAPETQIFKEAW